MKKILFGILILLVIIIFTCIDQIVVYHEFTGKNNSSPLITQTVSSSMTISSTAFKNNTTIPDVYTCNGRGINPPITVHNVPSTAKSLVVIIFDPDVSKSLLSSGIFYHWVVYNIDPKFTSILADSEPHGIQGLNSAGKNTYYAPCPPDNTHRYFFSLFALNTNLTFTEPLKVTAPMIYSAIHGHIIASAEIIGLYNRSANK